MDPRLPRSPSPGLPFGREGKPLAHMKHSRPSSRSSSRTSSRPSSRGSPYTQNPMLLSALHSGASPFLGLPAIGMQHRISPVPLPPMGLFQGQGLVNILPPNSTIPPAGAISPEILNARSNSCSSSISPGSQSSVGPLNFQLAEFYRQQQAQHGHHIPEALPPNQHRMDYAAIKEHYQLLEMASQRAEQGLKGEHESISMPPPPIRDPRHDLSAEKLIFKEQIHAAVRDRERERYIESETKIPGGALAQLMKSNLNQPTKPSASMNDLIRMSQGNIQNRTVAYPAAGNTSTTSGKPFSHSILTSQLKGQQINASSQHHNPSNNHYNIQSTRDTNTINSVRVSVQASPYNARGVSPSNYTSHVQSSAQQPSVITVSVPASMGHHHLSDHLAYTNHAHAHLSGQLRPQNLHNTTMTTTVHTGLIHSSAAYSQVNDSAVKSSPRLVAAIPKPIIAQKPASVYSNATSVDIVRIPSAVNSRPELTYNHKPPQITLNNINIAHNHSRNSAQKVEPLVSRDTARTGSHIETSSHSQDDKASISRTFNASATDRKQSSFIGKQAKPELLNGDIKEEGLSIKEENDLERVSPLNKRVMTLCNFPSAQANNARVTYRSHAMAVHRAKAGSITNAAKSLDLLRQNLQKFINKEIDTVVQKYVENYFRPALDNIRENGGEENLALDEYLNNICAQLLEEAKRQYANDTASVTTDVQDNLSDVGSVSSSRPSSRAPLVENKEIRAIKHSLFNIKKRRGSSDSDASTSRKRVRKPKNWGSISGRSTPSKKTPAEMVRKDGPRWDPERLTIDVQFVMGARANKALGLGSMRGRLYAKHQDLFKYIGDTEDKTYLQANRFMPTSGGKAYLLVTQDILDLAESPEYKDSPGLMMDEIVSFSVPQWMIDKMKRQMQQQRLASAASKPALVNPSTLTHTAQNSDDEDGSEMELPFSSMYSPAMAQASPATTDNLDNLSFDEDDCSQASPLQMTGGFSPAPSAPSPAPSTHRVASPSPLTHVDINTVASAQMAASPATSVSEIEIETTPPPVHSANQRFTLPTYT